MKRFHLALSASSIEESGLDYSARLEQQPDVQIPNEYALWSIPTLNFSLKRVPQEKSGTLRHLGWKSPDPTEFLSVMDVNHIPWEHFTAAQQDDEIRQTWPNISHPQKP